MPGPKPAAGPPPAATVPEGSDPSHVTAVVAPATVGPQRDDPLSRPTTRNPAGLLAPQVVQLGLHSPPPWVGGTLENAEKRDLGCAAGLCPGARSGPEVAFRTGVLDSSPHGSYLKGQVEAEAWEWRPLPPFSPLLPLPLLLPAGEAGVETQSAASPAIWWPFQELWGPKRSGAPCYWASWGPACSGSTLPPSASVPSCVPRLSHTHSPDPSVPGPPPALFLTLIFVPLLPHPCLSVSLPAPPGSSCCTFSVPHVLREAPRCWLHLLALMSPLGF